MTDKNQILPILREIYLNRVKNPQKTPIEPENNLASLGIDSLAMSWLIADIEEKFGIMMYGSDVIELKTVADVIAFIEKAKKG